MGGTDTSNDSQQDRDGIARESQQGRGGSERESARKGRHVQRASESTREGGIEGGTETARESKQGRGGTCSSRESKSSADSKKSAFACPPHSEDPMNSSPPRKAIP